MKKLSLNELNLKSFKTKIEQKDARGGRATDFFNCDTGDEVICTNFYCTVNADCTGMCTYLC